MADSNENVYIPAVTAGKVTIVKNEPIEEKGKLTVSSETARSGEEVTVGVSISENPGFAAITLGINYDETKLSLIGFEDSGLQGWTVLTNAVWVGNENAYLNGEILKLKFKVQDNAPEGDALITLKCGEGDMVDENEKVYLPSITAGKITIKNLIPGDLNGDGKVNALDLVRLKRYLGGENVTLVVSGDITGDGKINALDLVRLKRYLGGENVEIH